MSMKDEVPDLEILVPVNQLVDFGNDELRAAVPFNVLVNVEIRLLPDSESGD